MLIPLGCALLGASFLMSGHYVPWPSFEPQWVAGLGAALVALGALVGDHQPAGRRWSVPALALGALALAAVPLAQWATGWVAYRSDTLIAATYLAAFSLMVVLGRALSSGPAPRLLPWLQGGLLAGAALSAVIAMVQWLRLDVPTIYIMPMVGSSRPFGNLAQPNHLASLLCLGLAATLYFYETRRFGGLVAASCGLLLGWGLVLAQSRAGWLMVALLTIGWVLLRRRAAPRLSMAGAVVSVSLFVTAVAVFPQVNDALLLPQLRDAVVSTSDPGSGHRLQSGTRALHWVTLADAALRAPWLGYGWGQVSVAQTAAVLDHPASGEWVLNSHNLVLDLVIHNGLPIGLLATGLLAWWLARRTLRCRSGEQFAVLAGVAMIFAHEMVEFPLDHTYFLLPVGLLMGALHAFEPDPPRVHSVSRSVLAAWVLALTGMLGWIGVEYMKVEAAARQLRFVLHGVGVDKMPDAPEPDVWLLDQPRQFHRFMMMPAREGLTAEQLAFMRRNTERAARPNAMLRLALALGLNGQAEESAQWLRRICKMHVPARCDEGRSSWAAAQQQWPALAGIAYPPTPRELLR
jgi:O-antigen ligase